MLIEAYLAGLHSQQEKLLAEKKREQEQIKEFTDAVAYIEKEVRQFLETHLSEHFSLILSEGNPNTCGPAMVGLRYKATGTGYHIGISRRTDKESIRYEAASRYTYEPNEALTAWAQQIGEYMASKLPLPE